MTDIIGLFIPLLIPIGVLWVFVEIIEAVFGIEDFFE